MYPRRNKGSNKRVLKLQHVSLVSCSHSGNPKMADPANVWDLPIQFFLAFKVEVWLENLQKALRANNRSSLAKDETLDPLWRPVAQFEKTTRRNNNFKMLWCCGPIPWRVYFAFL